MAVNSICLVGNLDALGASLTLAGVLAYVRHRDKEAFFWFILAFPFKQQAAFIYLPLLLLRDKNLFRISFKFIIIALFTMICDLPLRNTPGNLAAKNKFFFGMLARMSMHKLQFLSSEISIFVLLYGLLCIYCCLHKEPENKQEQNTLTLFVAIASITIALSAVMSHPQWFLQLAPYLAIAIMYYGKATKELFLFETVGALGLLGYNFIFYHWVYTPNNAHGMLFSKLIGYKQIISIEAVRSAVVSGAEPESRAKFLKNMVEAAASSFGAVYTACIIAIIIWLCRPSNVDTECKLNIKPYAVSRMLINMLACYIPLAAFYLSAVVKLA